MSIWRVENFTSLMGCILTSWVKAIEVVCRYKIKSHRSCKVVNAPLDDYNRLKIAPAGLVMINLEVPTKKLKGFYCSLCTKKCGGKSVNFYGSSWSLLGAFTSLQDLWDFILCRQPGTLVNFFKISLCNKKHLKKKRSKWSNNDWTIFPSSVIIITFN